MSKNNLIGRNSLILAAIVSLTTLFACSKQDLKSSIEEKDVKEDSKRKVLVNTLSLSDIMYHEDADSGPLFDTYVNKQTTTTYGITKSSLHFDGDSSARFELHDTDAMNNNGTRAEITFPMMTNNNRWYAFAAYFPSAYYQYDTKDEVINQWHQGGGLTPSLCIRTRKDKMYMRVMGTLWLDLGSIPKDSWNKYVMHINHASDSTGRVEMWKNGTKILDYSGQNMYVVGGSVINPNWKIGVYKSGWNDNDTTDTDVRILYFDDIKMGDEDATYADMEPTN